MLRTALSVRSFLGPVFQDSAKQSKHHRVAHGAEAANRNSPFIWKQIAQAKLSQETKGLAS